MDKYFAKFTTAFWMRVSAGVSTAIFLVVIALSQFSINRVHDLSFGLESGPLAWQSSWQAIALHVAGAERVRLVYAVKRDAAAMTGMVPVVTQIEQELAHLPGEASQEVRTKIGQYTELFRQVVETDLAAKNLYEQLKNDREQLESGIYELNSPELERALGDLLMAEMGYWMSHEEKFVKSITVLMALFSRNTLVNDQEKGLHGIIKCLRKPVASGCFQHHFGRTTCAVYGKTGE